MADSSNPAPAASQAQQAQPPKPAPKPPNPALRMLGLPNFRFRLPSRNWMIFWTITGSFTAALAYDRREKRRSQQKWCDLVAHLSKETLDINQTRRKLTIYLAAPPGDGLRVARDHFKEYVKPILVAAALDYQVIEGRREGDVRAGTAESIRKLRRKAGEPSSVVEDPSVEQVITEARQSMGVSEELGPKGDIVIGRHTWREYIRGLHEGWLGPLDPPPPPPAPVEETAPASTAPEGTAEPAAAESQEKPEDNVPEKKEDDKEKKEEKKPTGPAPAYIAPGDYPSRALPSTLPQSFEGSVPIALPHILGFLNTPIRMYRYLTQRRVAESIGHEVAGAVLASYSRPYHDGLAPSDPASPANDVTTDLPPRTYEQQSVLEGEEPEWHKSVRKRDPAVPENGDQEREWLDNIVLDPRIASRMHRYTLSPEEEARAQRILEGKEYILGEERPAPVPFWKHLWIKYGYGEDEETLKRKPILGNIDGEDGQ